MKGDVEGTRGAGKNVVECASRSIPSSCYPLGSRHNENDTNLGPGPCKDEKG